MRGKILQILGFALIFVVSIGMTVSDRAEHNPIGYVFLYLAEMDFVFLLSAIIPSHCTAEIKIKYFDDEIDVSSNGSGRYCDSEK